MGSLIGKLLRNQGPPVPVGETGFYKLPTLSVGASADEDFLRAYGTQGTVFANVSLLASSTAKPDWRLYRKAAQDGRVRYTTNDQGSDQRTEVVKHQALSVLSSPNAFWTRFGLFELSQIWLELTGKSHWLVERDPRSNLPLGLWPVRPDRLDPVPDPKTYLKGWIYTAPDGREKIPLNPDEVIFNRYPNPMDVYGGLGPIQSVLVDVDASRYSAEWNRNFFINSATPGGVIQVDHRLEDDEWNELTDRWRETHRGVARAHRVAVLEAGATWVPNSMTVKDMDFSNLRTTGRDIIREALGMHKVMTGVTDDVNRANAQTGEEVFASWKIVPRLDRWADVLNSQFLPMFYPPDADIPVEFDYSFPMPLNREQDNAELQAKAQAVLWLIQAGYDPHDVLEVVGLPDMGTIETTDPILPPGTTPALPGAPAEAAPPDDMAARVRSMLRNGHLPVLTGASR